MSKLITLGAGCFWCVEATYRHVKGVSKAVSGYTGGSKLNPTYKDICEGSSGHAEVVQVEYNPQVIKTEDLLKVYFTIHDPTQLNRQGADVGTQYRSAIFYHEPEQKVIAEKVIKELQESGTYKDKIVTEVTKMEKFWPAEDYHQDYFQNNPNQGYCQAVVRPKFEKFKKNFKDLFV